MDQITVCIWLAQWQQISAVLLIHTAYKTHHTAVISWVEESVCMCVWKQKDNETWHEALEASKQYINQPF